MEVQVLSSAPFVILIYMKIVIISGSAREGSESRRVADYLKKQLDDKDVESEILDLHKNKLSIVPDDIWDDDPEQKALAAKLMAQLESADGYVMISPEWNGMANPSIKNLFVHVKHEMQHKPALLVGVSSGRGGAYPMAELRMSTFKNSHLNYIPEQLVIRQVKDLFHGELDESNESDVFYRKRANYALDILLAYTKGLQQVRDMGVINTEDYPTGM